MRSSCYIIQCTLHKKAVKTIQKENYQNQGRSSKYRLSTFLRTIHPT